MSNQSDHTLEIQTKRASVVLDATVLSTLMSCARLTDFKFNMHLQPLSGKSDSLQMGSIVHIILENFYGSIRDGKSRVDSIENGMKAGIEYIASEEVTLDPKDSAWALKTAEEYFEFYKNDSWEPLIIEEVVGRVLYEDDEIRILWKAKLDLKVDTANGIYPVDHKTMKQRRDTISLNNQFIGQCLVTESRSMIVNKIGFQTTLKPVEKFTRAVVSYSADRLLEWQSEILPYWAKQLVLYNESGYYPPNFTHCENKFGVCQFKSVCEANREMREEELKNGFKVGEPWDPVNSEKD